MKENYITHILFILGYWWWELFTQNCSNVFLTDWNPEPHQLKQYFNFFFFNFAFRYDKARVVITSAEKLRTFRSWPWSVRKTTLFFLPSTGGKSVFGVNYLCTYINVNFQILPTPTTRKVYCQACVHVTVKYAIQDWPSSDNRTRVLYPELKSKRLFKWNNCTDSLMPQILF